ncbi:MAG: YkgJ family cysteine cluster protein [Desulfotignum sp.]
MNHEPLPGTATPCRGCGACCAFFSVAVTDETVPCHLVCLDHKYGRFMKGTQAAFPRCAALEGVVGVRVKCTIYLFRPAVCRDFTRSWENSRENPLCDRARSVYGLQPFSPY